MTVIPEEPSQLNLLRSAFLFGTRIKTLGVDFKGSVEAC